MAADVEQALHLPVLDSPVPLLGTYAQTSSRFLRLSFHGHEWEGQGYEHGESRVTCSGLATSTSTVTASPATQLPSTAGAVDRPSRLLLPDVSQEPAYYDNGFATGSASRLPRRQALIKQ